MANPASIAVQIDVAEEILSGWAVSLTDPARNLHLCILIDGRMVLEFPRDKSRPDLDHLPQYQPYGFEIILPEYVKNADKYVLRVSDEDDQVTELSIYKKADDEKVLKGKDRWLFIHNDSNATMEMLSGLKALDDSSLHYLVNDVKSRANILRGRGIGYKHVIIPEKACVFADRLPDNSTISENRPSLQLQRRLCRTTEDYFGYLLDDFSGRHKEHFFQRGDTHLTDRGMYRLSNLIIRSLLGCQYSLPTPSWIKTENIGDLASKLRIPNADIVDDAVYDNEHDTVWSDLPTEPTGVALRGSVLTALNRSAATDRSLLLIGTSSAHKAVKHFAQIYQKTVFIWSNWMPADMLNELVIDDFIHIQAERFIQLDVPEVRALLRNDIAVHLDRVRRIERFLSGP